MSRTEKEILWESLQPPREYPGHRGTSSQSQIPPLTSEIDSLGFWPCPFPAARRKRFEFKIREERRLKWPHLPPKSPRRTAGISATNSEALAPLPRATSDPAAPFFFAPCGSQTMS
ncbi:uncharacterized protein LOC143434160 [Arvicanthis niloticus]|uniref:uncharacterized protein LOC143308575 n=1 Tax=Arvicanthis niloticus TaxID=61156 RepID=UPI00402BD1FC